MPFSIVNRGERWFWCSLLEVRATELIGPFPSQQEEDARATLEIEEAAPDTDRLPHRSAA
jgi:hypothetical protein